MRTVLAWMTFGPAILSGRALVPPSGFYAQPSTAWYLLILPLFLVFLMAAVHIWTVKVEPTFARATKRLEELVTGGREGRTSPIVHSTNGFVNGHGKTISSDKGGHVRAYSNGVLEQQTLCGNGHARKTSKDGKGFVYLQGQNGYTQ